MIETKEDYTSFINSTVDHSLILHLVLDSSYIHPTIDNPCVVLIRDVISKKTYCISFGHEDLLVVVNKEMFIKFLNDHKPHKWAFDMKSFIQHFLINNIYDANLLIFLYKNKMVELERFETSVHQFFKRQYPQSKCVNKYIPLMKHIDTFDKMCEEFLKHISGCECDMGFKKENEVIVKTLSQIESNGICVDENLFGRFFDAPVYDGKVYSKYNIYTPTGRPSNHFDKVNYAALKKDGGSRNCFISRFGLDGKMVLVDYSAFHPRIICYLTDFDIAPEINIYEYLAQLYFQKEEINDQDLDDAKILTFKQLYGWVEEKYEHIKYFKNLKDFINRYWQDFIKDGFIKTPLFKRIMIKDHVSGANPSKLFNYVLQATETELGVGILREINTYLKGRPTLPVLYTYDSILFDFHVSDGEQVLSDIIKIMTLNNKFPVKAYSGKSYGNMNRIY